MGKSTLSGITVLEDGIQIGQGIDAVKIKGSNLAIVDAATKVAGNYPDNYPWDGSAYVYPVADIESGLDPTYPPDNVPVARIPKAIRDIKVAAVVYGTIPAVFATGTVCGDIVAFNKQNGQWAPLNIAPTPAPIAFRAVQEIPQIPWDSIDFVGLKNDSPIIGVAVPSINAVLVSPVVTCETWQLTRGVPYYVSETEPGKLSTTPSRIFVGYSVSEKSIIFDPDLDIEASLSALRDALDTSVTKINETITKINEAFSTTEADYTALIEEAKRVLGEDYNAKITKVTEDYKAADTLLDTKIDTTKSDLTAEISTVQTVLRSEIDALSARHDVELADLRTTLVNTKTELQTAITAVETALNEYKTYISNELTTKFAQVDTRFDEVAANFTTVNTSISNLDSAVDTINTTIDGIQTNITRIDGEIDAIEQKNTAQDATVSALATKVSTNETNITKNTTDITQVTTGLGTLTTTVTGIGDKVTALETQTDGVTGEALTALTTRVTTAEGEIDALQTSNTDLDWGVKKAALVSGGCVSIYVDSTAGVDASIWNKIPGETGSPGSSTNPYKTVNYALEQVNKVISSDSRFCSVWVSLVRGGTYPMASQGQFCRRAIMIDATGTGENPVIVPATQDNASKYLFFSAPLVRIRNVKIEGNLLFDYMTKGDISNIVTNSIVVFNGSNLRVYGSLSLGIAGVDDTRIGRIVASTDSFIYIPSVSGSTVTVSGAPPSFVYCDKGSKVVIESLAAALVVPTGIAPANCARGSFVGFYNVPSSHFSVSAIVDADSKVIFMAG